LRTIVVNNVNYFQDITKRKEEGGRRRTSEEKYFCFKKHIMRDYKKLEVWKKAHETYLFIKKEITSKFPKEERFELTAQLNRAALSIPLNIVEGCGRYSDKDFAHFLDTSLGSTNETD
jgi:hypothetical protein